MLRGTKYGSELCDAVAAVSCGAGRPVTGVLLGSTAVASSRAGVVVHANEEIS